MINEEYKYIGITLGPIIKTIEKGEKTREMWGASYLFAYLCRSLMVQLRDKEVQFLLPSPSSLPPSSTPAPNKTAKAGVGLYPDHILFKTQTISLGDVDDIVKDVKSKLVDSILVDIENYSAFDPYANLFQDEIKKTDRKDAARKYLYDYLQVYSLEAGSEDLKLVDDKNKPLGVVKSLNLYLSHLELRSSIAGFDPDPVKVFLRGINQSFLLKEAFGDGFDHFPSLPEISTTEFRFVMAAKNNKPKFRASYDQLTKMSLEDAIKQERNTTNAERTSDEPRASIDDKVEEDIQDQLFSMEGIDNYVRTYHKYIAIVHADGDRIGKLIGSLSDDAAVEEFSKDLLLFSKEANKIMAGSRFTEGDNDNWGYGGCPVYIGGDEMVFFAPVASLVTQENNNQQFQTVFHLINSLDACFNEIFNKRADKGYEKCKTLLDGNRPCISYGVSVTYIKHPLKEAYADSKKLLMEVKTGAYKTRNRIHFRVRKHSGQFFGGIIDKNYPDQFNAFLHLLDNNNNASLTGTQSGKFINSVSKKVLQYKSAIQACCSLNSGANKEGIEALFENIFNEPIHEQYKGYLNQVRDLLIGMLEPYAGKKEDLAGDPIEETLSTLHGILRFIHFVRDNEL